MKKIVLIFSIFFVSSSMAFATGEYWKDLTHESKTVYVVGYRDGNNTGLGVAEFICQNKTEEETNAVDIQKKRQKVIAENINTVVSRIDKFYSDYANQKLPIPVAIVVVVSRLLGEPEEEIQKYIEEHRKEFNTP